MKKLIFSVGVLLSFSACTINRTISFNENRSGNMSTIIDMTSMMQMMGEYGGGGSALGNLQNDQSIELSKQALASIEGISNVQVSFDTTGIFTTSYDFSSVTALQNAMNSGGTSTNLMGALGGNELSSSGAKITFKGKKFFMEELDKKALKKLDSEESKKELGEMEMVLASSTINTTLNFTSPVKKVSLKNASITNDKTVFYSTPMKNYISRDYKPLTVILK